MDPNKKNNDDDFDFEPKAEPIGEPTNIIREDGKITEDSFFDTIADIDAEDDGKGDFEDLSFTELDDAPPEEPKKHDIEPPLITQAKQKEPEPEEMFSKEQAAQLLKGETPPWEDGEDGDWNKDEEQPKVVTQPLKAAPLKNKAKVANPSVTKPANVSATNKNTKGDKLFMGLNDESGDPNDEAAQQFWKSLNDDDMSDYKIQVHRLEPQTLKGVKISGYLETYYLPTTIPDIIEKIGLRYGGGKYQIKIIDSTGKYVKSKSFEIAGFPKLPDREEETPAPAPAPAPNPVVASPLPTNKPKDQEDAEEEEDEEDARPRRKKNRRRDEEEDDEDGLEDDYGWEDDGDEDDDLDFRPKKPQLRPVNPWEQQAPWGQPSPYPPLGQPNFREKNSEEEAEKVKKELEAKMDSKFEKITNLLNTVLTKKEEKAPPPPPPPAPLITPELVSAALPVVQLFMESRSSKDNVLAEQFNAMNQRIVSLVESMKEQSRFSDKSKEEIIERERREREQARKEMLEQQQRAEERLQSMMLKLQEGMERRFSTEQTVESKFRSEFEKTREEARAREEQLREQARAREEQAREETRKREEEARKREEEIRRREEAAREEARRREVEFQEKMRQEELTRRKEEEKWREEIRARDEENRKKEEKWREEQKQRELAAEREARARELEIQERLRQFELQKFQMEQKLIEQVYASKVGTTNQSKEVELALAKITGENDMKMYQAQSQMALEKMRMQTEMTIQKMKQELELAEKKPPEKDPLEDAIADFMKKKTQLMMIKELGLEDEAEAVVPEGDPTMGGVMKKVINHSTDALGPLIHQILGGLTNPPTPTVPTNARVVEPTHNPMPQPRPQPPVQPQPQPHQPQAKPMGPPPAPPSEKAPEKAEAKDNKSEADKPEAATSAPNQTPNASEMPAAEDVVNAAGINLADPQELMQVLQTLGELFDEYKEAFEAGEDPQECAQLTKEVLPPPIVQYLAAVGDSAIIIKELEQFLNVYNPEYTTFFSQEPVRQWLNKLLQSLK